MGDESCRALVRLYDKDLAGCFMQKGVKFTGPIINFNKAKVLPVKPNEYSTDRNSINKRNTHTHTLYSEKNNIG